MFPQQYIKTSSALYPCQPLTWLDFFLYFLICKGIKWGSHCSLKVNFPCYCKIHMFICHLCLLYCRYLFIFVLNCLGIVLWEPLYILDTKLFPTIYYCRYLLDCDLSLHSLWFHLAFYILSQDFVKLFLLGRISFPFSLLILKLRKLWYIRKIRGADLIGWWTWSTIWDSLRQLEPQGLSGIHTGHILC